MYTYTNTPRDTVIRMGDNSEHQQIDAGNICMKRLNF